MRISKIHAWLLVPVCAAGLWAEQPANVTGCRATLNGKELTTVVEFGDGYRVVGPWRVVATRNGPVGNGNGVLMHATLDRIIEHRPETGRDVTTPFPRPIETRFEGANQNELVTRAAHIWCMTVMKVQQENGSRPSGPERPVPSKPKPARSGGVHLASASGQASY